MLSPPSLIPACTRMASWHLKWTGTILSMVGRGFRSVTGSPNGFHSILIAFTSAFRISCKRRVMVITEGIPLYKRTHEKGQTLTSICYLGVIGIFLLLSLLLFLNMRDRA